MKLKRKYNRLKSGSYLLLLMALPVFCYGSNGGFAHGNQQYAKGQYKQAVKSYQEALSGDYQSATVYFNLGNAYYKLDDVPSALLYYEKAHKLNPADEDINFNIRMTNLKTTDKLEQIPEFFAAGWWHSFILGVSANTLAVVCALLFLTGFVVLGLY